MIKDNNSNNSVSGISWIRYKGLSNEIIMDNTSKVIIKVKNFVKCDIEDLAIFGLEMTMPYHMSAFFMYHINHFILYPLYDIVLMVSWSAVNCVK